MSTENNTQQHQQQQQQNQSCTICSSPCRSAARPTCSLRCSWKSSGHCVQCGRKVKLQQQEGGDNSNSSSSSSSSFTTFCGPLCLGEARRGNWCIGCGVKQVSTQGVSRCSSECMAVDIPFSLTDQSAFPSRRTTPGDDKTNGNNNNNNNNDLSSKNNNNNNNSRPNSREIDGPNHQQGARVTCAAVQPGSKLWDRITTPFHRQGLQCFQVIKVNNTASDKKAYNAYRLACDQKISSQKLLKYGFGGEGCEHKRFYSLMPGCGSHVWGLRLGSQVAPSQQQQQNGGEIEGFAATCQDPYCDVCRILDSGLKLTSIAGRPSHFSVPTLESVLPWCNDTASTVTSTHFSPVDGSPYQYTQRFQAVALVRTALGKAHVVNDMKDVAVDRPPADNDSVVMVREEDKLPNQPGTCKTDSAFTYNDQSILCEYIVLFDTNPNAQPQQQQQLGNTSSLNTSSSTSEQPMF